MPEVDTPNNGEREFETGTDEFFKAHSELIARRSQLQFDQIQNVALQALQNSVETANMVAKQAVRHADVAADALWTDELNPITRGAGSNLTAGAVPANRATDVSAAGVGVDAQAVAAAVAKQVDATITPVLATLQQIVQALASATTSIANVVNQAQPKVTA